MDRLPLELLSKICDHAGVGVFPALSRVSRMFNLACQQALEHRSEACGYPAALDYYTPYDLARLGLLEPLNAWAAAKQPLAEHVQNKIFIAACEGGCLAAAQAYPPALDITTWMETLRTATARNHMHIVDFMIGDAPKPDRWQHCAHSAILEGMVQRKASVEEFRPYNNLGSAALLGITACLESGIAVLSGAPNLHSRRPMKNYFFDCVHGGHQRSAATAYALRDFELSTNELYDLMAAALKPTRSNEFRAWVLGLLAVSDDAMGNVNWSRLMKSVVDTDAHVFMIRSTAQFARPYIPFDAMALGLPVYLAMVEHHPSTELKYNSLSLICSRDIESIEYCIGRGADVHALTDEILNIKTAAGPLKPVAIILQMLTPERRAEFLGTKPADIDRLRHDIRHDIDRLRRLFGVKP